MQVRVAAAELKPVRQAPVRRYLNAIGRTAQSICIGFRHEFLKIGRRRKRNADRSETLDIVMLVVKAGDIDIQITSQQLAIAGFPPDLNFRLEVWITGNLDEQRRIESRSIADQAEIAIDPARSA